MICTFSIFKHFDCKTFPIREYFYSVVLLLVLKLKIWVLSPPLNSVKGNPNLCNVWLCFSVWGWRLWAGGKLSELPRRLRHLPDVHHYQGGHWAPCRALQQWLHPDHGGQSMLHRHTHAHTHTHTHTHTQTQEMLHVLMFIWTSSVAPVPETEDVLGWKLDHQLQEHNI